MSSKTINLIVWASIFAATFLLSFVLFVARPGRTDHLVLFFPSETTEEWIGEGRNIPYLRNTEDGVHELLKEIALGPVHLRLEAALPKNTRVRSVLLRSSTLYVDFTEHLAMSGRNPSVSFPDILKGVAKSVLFNYPSIEEVVIFVRGFPAG